nr:hypothetical protein GCM10010200_049190 [Actinomadura rugatobispora]
MSVLTPPTSGSASGGGAEPAGEVVGRRVGQGRRGARQGEALDRVGRSSPARWSRRRAHGMDGTTANGVATDPCAAGLRTCGQPLAVKDDLAVLPLAGWRSVTSYLPPGSRRGVRCLVDGSAAGVVCRAAPR